MRSRRPTPEHQEAVSRRLALLSAELSSVRPPPPSAPTDLDDDEPPWWDEHTRIAAPRRPPGGPLGPPPGAPPPLPSSLPPPVPVPGRHAARRRRSATDLVPDLVPATLRGRLLLGPAQLAVVAVVVALGLAVTTWWVVRSDPEPAEDVVAAPARPLVDVSGPAGAAEQVTDQVAGPATGQVAGEGASAAASTVTVDVAGKVRRPGIAVLDAGARVVDAIAAAGGVRAGVDVSGLNLARVLVDGEQVLVGVPLPPGVGAGVSPTPDTAAVALVNLNTADGSQLETLPEVGPVTASSILTWRDEHGGFTSVDELLEVDGIGEATLARIAPHVTV